MREIVAEGPALQPRGARPSTRAQALRRPALQGRDHRRRRASRDAAIAEADRAEGVAGNAVSAYRNTAELRRPLPGPARADHRPARPLQAHEGGRRLLARRRAAPPAAADLRDRMGVEGGAGRAPAPAGGGGEARPPPARRRARPVPLPARDRRRPAGLPPQGRPDPQADGGLLQGRAREGRATSSCGRPHLAKSTLFEKSGHLGWYADSMYPPMEMEGATYYPKPMNCPMHILIYKSRPALLPGAALPAVRVRDGLPLRAIRRAERAAPGPRHHPGRRPHLLHP